MARRAGLAIAVAVVMAALLLVCFLVPTEAVFRLSSRGTVVESTRAVLPVDAQAFAAPPPPPHPHPHPHPPPPPRPQRAVRLRERAPAASACNASECSVSELVARYAVDDTVIVTFGNAKQLRFTENWVHHLHLLGVRGLLVGLMAMGPADPLYASFATSMRARGVGVYGVNSAEVARNPQGGRWFHVLPLLATGKRVVLSDSDVVWLRDPRPYLRALELVHPRMDLAVSTDSQHTTDLAHLGAASERGSVESLDASGSSIDQTALDLVRSRRDLDLEGHSLCWVSMNIGIMLFPPGRPGAMRAMREATTHLLRTDHGRSNLNRVDQGPINYRWKHGAGDWRWTRQLHSVTDATGKRLCGLVNGTVIGAVLPAAQFCNTLTHSVLRLWHAAHVEPYALHATWMRRQEMPWKVMRLREQTYWLDPPEWYAPPSRPALGENSPTNSPNDRRGSSGYVTYDASLPAELLRVPRIGHGDLPLHHMKLMHEQLRRLRNALFISRLLNRALVLPPTLCSCEIGFWIKHVEADCRVGEHTTLILPYVCAIDHYLYPDALESSPYAHRERTFLDNPRTDARLRSDVTRVALCLGPKCAETAEKSAEKAAVSLPRGATDAEIISRLGGAKASVLHFDDVLGAFGGFAGPERAVRYHDDAQRLLSSWCCTAEAPFGTGGRGGEVPYLLPPLRGQMHWRGSRWHRDSAAVLSAAFKRAGEGAIAADLAPCRRWSGGREATRGGRGRRGRRRSHDADDGWRDEACDADAPSVS